MLSPFWKLPVLFPLLSLHLVQPQIVNGQVSIDPEVYAVFPVGGQQGTSVQAEIYGKCLDGAYAIWFESGDLKAQIREIEMLESEQKEQTRSTNEGTCDSDQRILLDINIESSAPIGPKILRVVGERGVSNALVFLVNANPVIKETANQHSIPQTAQPVAFPTVINGKINKEREPDYYSFNVSQGQELAFEIIAYGRRSFPSRVEGRTSFETIPRMRWTRRFDVEGRYLLRVDSFRVVELVLPATAISFIPKLTLSKTTGTWLNPEEPVELTFDDERPDFSSQVAKTIYARNSPDFSYQLRIVPVAWPAIYEKWSAMRERAHWRERDFRRKLKKDRLGRLQSRTVVKEQEVEVSCYVEKETGETPIQIFLPALIEGAIVQPGDVDIFRFKVDDGERLAFEIETSTVFPPQFYPHIEVRDSSGFLHLSNAHRKLAIDVTDPLPYLSVLECLAEGAGCDLHSISYLEALESKVIKTFEQAGEYFFLIRNLTRQGGGLNHTYRVLIRSQVPHVGEIQLKEDRINLMLGEARKLTLITEMEEGFVGDTALIVEDLPKGVSQFIGTEFEEQAHPGDASVDKENFVPTRQKATLILVASATAETTPMPEMLQLKARPIVAGKLGPLITVGKIPIMVIGLRSGPKNSTGDE